MTVYARLNLNRGVAPSGRLLSERAFALLTKPALNNYAYTGPKQFDTPPEYAAYAGPYANHNPEEGAVHVLVRKGQLFLATGMGSGQRLLPTGPATFRPEAPDFNPERISFDSIVEGHALRLFRSGMPMYRMDVR
jgi:hypothetical protein